MPSSSEISPVAQAVLRREAERIAALGDGWAPTYANLREIAERVLAAEREEQARKQAAGIERARAAGSLSGRPAVHQVPENFSEIYRQLQARERTIAGTARELGVSASTLSRWIKSERERLGEGERK